MEKMTKVKVVEFALVHTTRKISKRLQRYQNKYPFVGPVLWISGLQYFIVMTFVGMSWPTHYSVLKYTISDLGNTACGMYDSRYVCSPQHFWMNASFMVLGITTTLGALLLAQRYRSNSIAKLSFYFMALAGVGTFFVGVFPENVNFSLHLLSASLPFVFGNLALLMVAFVLDLRGAMELFTIFCGWVSAIALALFVLHIYLGLGIGGMERLAAHLQTIWLIVFGAYLTRKQVNS